MRARKVRGFVSSDWIVGGHGVWLALLCVILEVGVRACSFSLIKVILFPRYCKGICLLPWHCWDCRHVPPYPTFYRFPMNPGPDDACMASTLQLGSSLQPCCSLDDTGWVDWVCKCPAFRHSSLRIWILAVRLRLQGTVFLKISLGSWMCVCAHTCIHINSKW